MVKRKIVRIDENKCDGCGLCVPACHEGAIEIVDGKARLVEERLCDGLGDCLGECPQGAIEIVEEEAEPFDEEAVKARQRQLSKQAPQNKDLDISQEEAHPDQQEKMSPCQRFNQQAQSGLKKDKAKSQWPIQLHLVSPEAPFLQGCNLLIAADCVGFSHPDFRRDILGDKTLIIACPKLDDASAYVDKLARIFAANHINSITVARMEVPCCGGLKMIVEKAMEQAGVHIPIEEKVISIQGQEKVTSQQ